MQNQNLVKIHVSLRCIKRFINSFFIQKILKLFFLFFFLRACCVAARIINGYNNHVEHPNQFLSKHVKPSICNDKDNIHLTLTRLAFCLLVAGSFFHILNSYQLETSRLIQLSIIRLWRTTRWSMIISTRKIISFCTWSRNRAKKFIFHIDTAKDFATMTMWKIYLQHNWFSTACRFGELKNSIFGLKSECFCKL